MFVRLFLSAPSRSKMNNTLASILVDVKNEDGFEVARSGLSASVFLWIFSGLVVARLVRASTPRYSSTSQMQSVGKCSEKIPSQLLFQELSPNVNVSALHWRRGCLSATF